MRLSSEGSQVRWEWSLVVLSSEHGAGSRLCIALGLLKSTELSLAS